MANRILFEDDINQDPNKIDGHNSKKETKMKEDNSTEFLIQETGKLDDTEIISASELSPDNVGEIMENIIILGSRVSKGNASSIESEDNVSEDDRIVTADRESKNKEKSKRKHQNELELLGIDVNEIEEEQDRDYDVFGNDNKIFRKYKLRKTEQPISYKEPNDIKPKRHDSTDDEPDFTCSVCQHEFENKVALLNHMRIHNKTVHEYTCSLCSIKFDRNADLIEHRKTHSSESFLCRECKLAFSDYCDYLLHNYEHLDRPHFRCSECGLRYRKSVYKQHILTHFKKILSCYLCSFVTSGEYNLKNHLNQHNYKLPCVECGKVFNNKKNYEYHMSMHTGVKKIQCLYCGKGFRTTNARDVHNRTHTGERPFTCDICGHKARQSTDLKRHQQVHDEKKCICDYCGKKYLHKYYLVVHMRSHTKKSLYNCPECDASFTSVNGLKTHTMFKHTSERPVECTLCNKKFINNNQYRKHCRAKYHLRNVFGHEKSKKEE